MMITKKKSNKFPVIPIDIPVIVRCINLKSNDRLNSMNHLMAFTVYVCLYLLELKDEKEKKAINLNTFKRVLCVYYEDVFKYKFPCHCRSKTKVLIVG